MLSGVVEDAVRDADSLETGILKVGALALSSEPKAA